MNNPTPVFIPEALKARAQWLVWKLENRDGKPSKVPYCVKTGHLGKSNDPASWCDFDTALKAALNGQGYDGIGFAFHEGDELAGVDVDYPWDSPIATEIRKRFKGTYCERSPSGKLRIFCRGKPQRCGKGTENKAIEVYDHTSPRYLSVTGEWIEGTSRAVTAQQEALDWLHETYFKPKEKPQGKSNPQAHVSLSVSDQEVIDKAKDARNGGKFSSLFYGGWQAAGYSSQSEADAALCSMLAFWTQEEGQIDRIFRQSALMRPKWDKKHHTDGRTYGAMTIQGALSAVTETYRAGFTEEGPSPWEDPPVESYADDPENQGQGPEETESESTKRARGNQEAVTWPDPLSKLAYHGLAGDIVRIIAPHSEAASEAILIQTLTAFGNIIGRGPFYLVEGDKHPTNLFCVLVGETAKGRKGTSWWRALQVFSLIEDPWTRDRIESGLSSGEGLIWAVRDPITRREKTGEEVEIDPGVSDKRLMIVEPEFAGLLRVLSREGNILSRVIRDAWDRGNLATMTKNSPARATGALVSIIGHITTDELRRYLDRTEAGNGFANRFVYSCVKRSKCLPEGGALSENDLHPLAQRMAQAIGHARGVGRIQFNEAARLQWHAVYPELSQGMPGLFGAVTSRAEAQVIRLALIYALLDLCTEIQPEHLKAAIALWEYAEGSARYIFGSALGDPLADEIYRALRAAGPAGLTRTQIRDTFSRHKAGGSIQRALELLAKHRLAVMQTQTTPGRPAEVWIAI